MSLIKLKREDICYLCEFLLLILLKKNNFIDSKRPSFTKFFNNLFFLIDVQKTISLVYFFTFLFNLLKILQKKTCKAEHI